MPRNLRVSESVPKEETEDNDFFFPKYPLFLRASGCGDKLQIPNGLQLIDLHFCKNIFLKAFQKLLERRGSQLCLFTFFKV